MNSKQQPTISREVFLLLWIILTEAAAIAGMLGLRVVFTEMGYPSMPSAGILLGAIPLLTSLVQWPLLISYRKYMHWWVPATFTGSLINGLFYRLIAFPLIIMGFLNRSLSGIGMLVLILLFLSPSSLIIGLAQWLVLRKNVNKSGLWILVATSCWSITNSLTYLGFTYSSKPILLVWIILSTFPTVISGAVMTYLIYIKSDKARSDLTPQRSSNRRLSFFSQWLLVTMFTMMLSRLIVLWMHYSSISQHAVLSRFGLSFTLPFFLTASAQWLVLRTRVRDGQAWISATLLGCLFIFLIEPVLSRSSTLVYGSWGNTRPLMAHFLYQILNSLPFVSLAFAQYLALQKKIARAVLWIPTIIIAGIVTSLITPYTFDAIDTMQFFSWLLEGCLQGLITGGMMTFMIFHPKESFLCKNDAITPPQTRQ